MSDLLPIRPGGWRRDDARALRRMILLSSYVRRTNARMMGKHHNPMATPYIPAVIILVVSSWTIRPTKEAPAPTATNIKTTCHPLRRIHASYDAAG